LETGIFKWVFHGDREQQMNVTKYFEELEDKQTKKEEVKETMFENEELGSYTQQQI
jgi:hypothetical protein